jgi:hypothetical protein
MLNRAFSSGGKLRKIADQSSTRLNAESNADSP